MSLFSWSLINHISREIRYFRPFVKQHRTHTDTVYGNRVNASGKKLVLKMISCGSQRGDSFRFIQEIEQFVLQESVTSNRIGNGLEDERSDWMQSLKSAPNQISFFWRKSLIPKISTSFRVPSPNEGLRHSNAPFATITAISPMECLHSPLSFYEWTDAKPSDFKWAALDRARNALPLFLLLSYLLLLLAHAFQDRHLFAFAIFALFFCQQPPPPPPSAFYSRTCVAVARRAKEAKCIHFMRSLTFDRIVFVFGFRFVCNERRVFVSMWCQLPIDAFSAS